MKGSDGGAREDSEAEHGAASGRQVGTRWIRIHTIRPIVGIDSVLHSLGFAKWEAEVVVLKVIGLGMICVVYGWMGAILWHGVFGLPTIASAALIIAPYIAPYIYYWKEIDRWIWE